MHRLSLFQLVFEAPRFKAVICCCDLLHCCMNTALPREHDRLVTRPCSRKGIAVLESRLLDIRYSACCVA